VTYSSENSVLEEPIIQKLLVFEKRNYLEGYSGPPKKIKYGELTLTKSWIN
jgi:hypothetical protein